MTVLGEHSSTSMAVKSVVSEVRKKLESRFKFLEDMPSFFYDFENGVTPKFKQYYAKIPISKRDFAWTALSYSYNSAQRSSVQPRNGFVFHRKLSPLLTRSINIHYVELPLLFSVLTNDSKNFNELINYILINFNWSFSTTYKDFLWPLWVPNAVYPIGWYIRPSKPNNCLYVCKTSGTSGRREPSWDNTINSTQLDNSVEWQCIEAPELTVKAGSFVKNDSTIKNPIDDGIMYQHDFGFTLHYTDYSDAGDYIGLITEIEAKLLNWGSDEVVDSFTVK